MPRSSGTLAGRPKALWPLMPYSVSPYLEANELRYRVMNTSGSPVDFPARDIFHLRGLTHDGVVGISVIQKARESLGFSIATERFGATFFGNGSTFGGVISYPPGAGQCRCRTRTTPRPSRS